MVGGENLSGTKATILFRDLYPSMAPTAGNIALLGTLNEVNRSLRTPEMEAIDPMLRAQAILRLWRRLSMFWMVGGAPGGGMHAPGESVNLAGLPRQSQRAAVLIYRLIRESSQ
jgi:glutamate carboxypeptidase